MNKKGGLGGLIFIIVLLLLGIGFYFYSPDKIILDKECLREKLCWDNGYNYQESRIYHFINYNEIRCYELTEKDDKLLRRFVDINYTKLNEEYNCKEG